MSEGYFRNEHQFIYYQNDKVTPYSAVSYGYKAANISEDSKERDALFEKRQMDISESCEKFNYSIASNVLLIDKIHSIYYCPIPKVGSTFWKRSLEVLTSQGKIKSPFDLTLNDIKLLSKSKHLSTRELEDLTEQGTSFMFVRNPYARLFSAYENKIYCPNLMFWKSTGSRIVKLVRSSRDHVHSKYGFDVTFYEFIKYILYQNERGKTINGHFRPMINICNPCQTHFDYIGKLETFADDAKFIITKWKSKFDDINITFGEKERTIDTVKGHLRFLYQAKRIVNTIKIPFTKLMLRTWRDLQIRGLLSKSIAFPFNASDSGEITKTDYLNAVLEALEIPVNHTEVKLQRHEALVQAYRQVPMADMEKLRTYLLKDCLIFNYEDRPKDLFDRSVPLNDTFLYIDGL
ncbi:carbohydrate sulfotransferase 11-like [Ruditapes philippinarum]|uniref:carbohydrate sulfotransferase 11-like n=1 Tax=Ruditapes philippinarum TaxID=129788 RepID=UPI00295BB9D3|nr:carbohydrate sulfotransferase 11-like [Ruditapes philippinarum]